MEVIAADRYDNAPAMQVADRSYTLSMLDAETLRALVEKEQPDLIVPEIEAIATDVLIELEREGFNVIPSAKAAQLTMNREGIRTLAANDLSLATSPFEFASTQTEFNAAV
ncbi:MAG: phosphoribosylglycinamide formyltransferase 2, partial [Flavobacteriales bacterium]